MWLIDDKLDVLRGFAFLISLYAVFILLLRFKRHHDEYNSKTKDIWFAMLMFSIAGCVAMVQGIALDRPFTPAFVCIVAAILALGKAVHKKGTWGGNAT